MASFISHILKGFTRKPQTRILVKDRTTQVMQSDSSNGISLSSGNLIKSIYDEDPDVRGAINFKVNSLLARGYYFLGDKNQIKRLKSILSRSHGNSFVRQVILNLILYKKAFVEIERKPSIKLSIIDTDTIRVLSDEHGNIKEYQQDVQEGEPIRLSPDNIWEVTFSDETTSIFPTSNLVSAYKAVATKNFIENFLSWLFETYQLRPIFKVQNVSNTQVKQFLADYLASNDDPHFPLTIEGSLEIDKIYEANNLQDLQNLIDSYRKRIFSLLHIPPSLMGMTENSNRSSFDGSYKILQLNNSPIREAFAEEFNNTLLKKLQINNVIFKWKPYDLKNVKDVVEIGKSFVQMGIKPNKLEEFLRMNGLELPDGRLFSPIGNEGGKITKNPSQRIPTPKNDRPSDLQKGEEINNIGTGEESTSREDQIIGKTKNFGKYPYILNE